MSSQRETAKAESSEEVGVTDDQLAYAAEFIDRAVFRMRCIGLTEQDIVEMLKSAARFNEEKIEEMVMQQ